MQLVCAAATLLLYCSEHCQIQAGGRISSQFLVNKETDDTFSDKLQEHLTVKVAAGTRHLTKEPAHIYAKRPETYSNTRNTYEGASVGCDRPETSVVLTEPTSVSV